MTSLPRIGCMATRSLFLAAVSEGKRIKTTAEAMAEVVEKDMAEVEARVATYLIQENKKESE